MKDCRECPFVQAQRDKSQETHHLVHVIGLLLSRRLNSGDVSPPTDTLECNSWIALKAGLQQSVPETETIDPRLLTGEDPKLTALYNECLQLGAEGDWLRSRAIRHAQRTCEGPVTDDFLQEFGVNVLHCTSEEKVGVWDA